MNLGRSDDTETGEQGDTVSTGGTEYQQDVSAAENGDTERTTELQFEDSVEIPIGQDTTKDDLWAVCSDPEVLVTAVPGAEEVEQLSERTYRGTITRGIHSITVSLDGEVELVELNEPDWVMASGNAYDSRSHSGFEGLAAMEVNTVDEETVRIDYRADVTLSGGVATVPARILRRIVGRDVNTYFENLSAELTETDEEEDTGRLF